MAQIWEQSLALGSRQHESWSWQEDFEEWETEEMDGLSIQEMQVLAGFQQSYNNTDLDFLVFLLVVSYLMLPLQKRGSTGKESQLNHSRALKINMCVSTIVRGLGTRREAVETSLN